MKCLESMLYPKLYDFASKIIANELYILSKSNVLTEFSKDYLNKMILFDSDVKKSYNYWHNDTQRNIRFNEINRISKLPKECQIMRANEIYTLFKKGCNVKDYDLDFAFKISTKSSDVFLNYNKLHIDEVENYKIIMNDAKLKQQKFCVKKDFTNNPFSKLDYKPKEPGFKIEPIVHLEKIPDYILQTYPFKIPTF